MKNILFIVVDTLRPDHLGCYGYERPTSPCLDALAEKSTVLESLWSASNFTAPAFTSLFTGLYPHQHGVFDFTAQAPQSPIFDIFKHNKTQTAGVVTFRFFQNLLSRIWGDIEAVTDTRSFNHSKDLPQAVTDSSLVWLKEHGKSGPFCLFVHYNGPHLPYRLPQKYSNIFDTINSDSLDPEFLRLLFPQDLEHLDETPGDHTGSMFKLLEDINWHKRKVSPEELQWIVEKYDASIRYNDQVIGDLLEGVERLGLSGDTIVVVLSDHGEEFMEHGAIGHGGIHLNEEIIRTVGIIHEPGGVAGVRVKQPLSQVDIFPTLLEMAGAKDLSAHWQGRSFARLTSSGKNSTPQNGPVFCHGKSKIAVSDSTHKFIKTYPTKVLGAWAQVKLFGKMLLRGELKSEIYDLAADPLELKNLIGNKSLRKKLNKIIEKHLAESNVTFSSIMATDEERLRIEKEMKALGYM